MEKDKKPVKNESDAGETSSNKVYEVGFHLVSSLPEEKIGEEFSLVKDLIEKNGGVFISEDFPKVKHLAYSIPKLIGTKRQNFNTAYFGWIKFEMDSESIKTIKKSLDTNPNVLRFIIIKTVRENTLITPKIAVVQKAEVSQKKEGEEDKKEVNAEEIDKSIDELVIE